MVFAMARPTKRLSLATDALVMAIWRRGRPKEPLWRARTARSAGGCEAAGRRRSLVRNRETFDNSHGCEVRLGRKQCLDAGDIGSNIEGRGGTGLRRT